jgi:hypothetical protein
MDLYVDAGAPQRRRMMPVDRRHTATGLPGNPNINSFSCRICHKHDGRVKQPWVRGLVHVFKHESGFLLARFRAN